MKLGIFCYNFKHWKTQTGLCNLMLHGFKPEIVFAANPVKLKFYKSKIRAAPKDLFLAHPKKICDFHNIKYVNIAHNSREVSELVEEHELDLGIILGARILKPVAYDKFNIGVLNMHPGILPENRGLDTIKWAIVKKLKQGVTTHLIDKKIDRGYLVDKKEINIYKDDTLLDLQIRIQNLEQQMMIEAINFFETKGIGNLKSLGQGEYHRSLPPHIEKDLFSEFDEYKERYIKNEHNSIE
jgi:phosphoribosylglycinamide formyltransferase-1